MVPFSKNEKFIGRSQVYERLRESAGRDETADEGGPRRLALYGIGGVGYGKISIFDLEFK